MTPAAILPALVGLFNIGVSALAWHRRQNGWSLLMLAVGIGNLAVAGLL